MAAALVLAGLAAVYRVAVAPRANWIPFNLVRARTAVRRPAGGNSLLLLAAVNLAAVVYDIAGQAATLRSDTVTAAVEVLLPIFLIATVILLVVSRSAADLLIGLIGIAAALTGAFLNHGIPAVVAILTIAVIAVFILGAARGLLRGHT